MSAVDQESSPPLPVVWIARAKPGNDGCCWEAFSESEITISNASPPPAPFDIFIGVDWSGARGPRLPGLQVAVAKAGRSAPHLIPGPGGGHWSRSAFAAWFVEKVPGCGRVLAGFDFAFSFPRKDQGQFFPGLARAPENAMDLWRHVDEACDGDDDFYAARFVDDRRYAPYFHTGVPRKRFERRMRITDERCRDAGLGRPESVFRLVGPAQVGKGSLAGMRVLHHLRGRMKHLTIWPFEAVPRSASAVVAVDMYPGAFVRLSGIAQGKVRDVGTLNDVLRSYGSRPVDGDTLGSAAQDGKADAIVAAAALRHLSRDGRVWRPAGLAEARRWQEGWIFGVP